MRSLLAGLVNLTLPAGVTTGRRIVLDGINGAINIFDSAGDLREQITSAGAAVMLLYPSPEGGHSFSPGAILGDKAVGANVAGTLNLQSPEVDGREHLGLLLIGEDTGGNPPVFRIDTAPSGGTPAGEVQVAAARFSVEATGDIQLGTQSLPRGVLPNGYMIATGNDAARAAGVATDMTVTVTADVTRLYEVTLVTQANVGTAAAVYALALDDGGTIVGRMGRWSAAETPAGSLTVFCAASVPWTPSSGSHTLTIKNDAGSGGTMTLTGGAAGPRYLAVKDVGAR